MGGEGKTAFGLHFKVKFANMNKVNYQKILEQTIEKKRARKPCADAAFTQLLCTVQFLLPGISFKLF